MSLEGSHDEIIETDVPPPAEKEVIDLTKDGADGVWDLTKEPHEGEIVDEK